MESVLLQNSTTQVRVSPLGAELKSAICRGKEYMWQGNQLWDGTAPVLFPICGRLLGGQYAFAGNTYAMDIHGFANTRTFTVERQTDTEAVFLLCSDAETKAVYPFDFQLRVIYRLQSTKVTVVYDVKNTGTAPLYFSAGCHETYACPEGIDAYTVEFDCPEVFDVTDLDVAFMTDNTLNIAPAGRCLPLQTATFRKIDSLVFTKLQSRGLILRSNDGKTAIRCEYPDFPYFLIWNEPGCNFICLEPWAGLPDYSGKAVDFSKKPGILTLLPGNTKQLTHSFEILD